MSCLNQPTGSSLASVFRKLGLLFAAVALFSIAGGHWGVLQTVAWAEMLRDYSQRGDSIAMAVEQTFDGNHPCELCREIQTAKSQENKSDSIPSKAKDDAKVKARLSDSVLNPFARIAAEISFRVLLRSPVPAAPSSRRRHRHGGEASRHSKPSAVSDTSRPLPRIALRFSGRQSSLFSPSAPPLGNVSAGSHGHRLAVVPPMIALPHFRVSVLVTAVFHTSIL